MFCLKIISSSDINIFRRLFWLLVFASGLSYSANMICRNALRYFEYPSVIKPVSGVRSTFPKVTICLNSMHSQQDLDTFYPGLAYLMPMYYGQLGIIHRQI